MGDLQPTKHINISWRLCQHKQVVARDRLGMGKFHLPLFLITNEFYPNGVDSYTIPRWLWSLCHNVSWPWISNLPMICKRWPSSRLAAVSSLIMTSCFCPTNLCPPMIKLLPGVWIIWSVWCKYKISQYKHVKP